MDISIILCTHNRCASLARALESAVALSLPDAVLWEIVVVDNNSSDRTREVTEQFCRLHPGRLRYLFETQPGKSHALNTGIREARGDVVAFMDDDVTVESTWVRNLTESVGRGECVGAGGRILPQWTGAPPRWLPRTGRYPLAPLALFDLGLEAGELMEAPFGTNMAFRKTMFEKYGGFRTDLGPNPNNMIRGEDTEFGNRLLAAGEKLRYEPGAVVYHAIPESRVQKTYFLAWWFDKARADIRECGIGPSTRWYVSGIPLFLFRRLTVWTLRWMVATKPSVRFGYKLNVWTNAGAITECYRRSHDSNEVSKATQQSR